jgi:hypothetical protein
MKDEINFLFWHEVCIKGFLVCLRQSYFDNSRRAIVNWSYGGSPDIAYGTGATPVERMIGFSGGLVGFILYCYFFIKEIYPWSLCQYIVAGILAFDVAGGLVCNCLNSCKRFYSSPLQSNENVLIIRLLKQHWIFTIIHIHPFIIQIYFGNSHSWFYGYFWYLTLQLNAFIILNMPLYLRRPMAMLFCLISLIMNYYAIPVIDGFEWFIPALFIKIIYGHLVQEEPYRSC